MSPLVVVLFVLYTPLAAAGANDAQDLSVVSNGDSEYRIVCSRRAPSATLLAATELQDFVERATGARLSIVAPARQGSKSIILRSDPSLPRDSFTMQVSGPNLLITGHDTKGDPRRIVFEDPVSTGTLYGVYEFLESFLGVRFYWPDDLGTYVPKRTTLLIPGGTSISGVPHFPFRRLQYGPGYKNSRDEAASRLWGRRLRLGAAEGTNFYHNWRRVLNVEEREYKRHPEYAALVNGVRETGYDGGNHRGQVCTSDPEVQKIFVKAARASTGPMFSVSPNDGLGMCECSRCQAQDGKRTIPSGKFSGHRDLSDRVVGFYNLIAEQAGRRVGGYAYNEFIEVPTSTKLHPNVRVSLAVNNAWASADPGQQAWANRLFHAWGAYASTTTVYDIFFYDRRVIDLIAPLGADIDRRVRLVADSGLAGGHFYIAPEMERGGPDAYVAARLMWDPSADGDGLREAYYRDLYGAAWQSVQQLYGRTVQAWRDAVVQHRRSERRRRRAFLRIMPDIERYMRRAERQAGNDPAVRERLARLRRAVDRMAKTE
jgi:hypothetical protein